MLHIQGLTKQFAGKLLFENADAHLNHRSRVALIGANGAGKSTLIKIILGLESADSGKISKVPRLAIGYLPQEVPKFSGRTVLEEVMNMGGRREELLQGKLEYEDSFSKTEATEADLERYGRILEELDHLDEYTLEARAKAILTGMGFKPSDFQRSLTEFSGGWLMRVTLSRVLLMDPDLLLLDEPTNHLDLESLLWLEDFLNAYRGALLIISHDTAFSNRIINGVLEISQKRLWSYQGNLDAYVIQKEERLKVLRAQYAGQQAKIAEIEAFVARFGAKATKASQAQSRLKQLEKMDLIELPDEESRVRFRFPPVPHSGKDIVRVSDAGVSYDDKVIFQNLNWVIQKGSRTAIVGVNGAGKTTLLKLLAQKLPVSKGNVVLGHEVKVGYYSQLQTESLNSNNTILQELEAVAPDMALSQVRAIAGAFLFTGDDVAKKCSVLSGGEKARVALAKLLLSPSNFLILDEPTNHLDVESRGVLLEALQNYSGTLCLVSHDRAFVGPLVNRVLEIVPSPEGSQVHMLTESYEDYLERKRRQISRDNKTSLEPSPSKTAAKSIKDNSSEEKVRTGPSNNQKKAWERELQKLEAEITALEKENSELQEQMADTSSYEDKQKTLLLIEKQREISSALGSKLNRWEELSGLLS